MPESNHIPESHRDLFERPLLFSFATTGPDGIPQVTPVWGDIDGSTVRVNTAYGRQKTKNLEDRPVAAVLVVDPDNPYRWIQVQGEVTLTREGAHEHIDQLSRKYTGRAFGERNPSYVNEDRVIVRITPRRVSKSAR
jgi:PPOX class probable F420-dependent enzyme